MFAVMSIQERKHVVVNSRPDRTVKLKLSPEGKSFLKEKSQKWYRKPEWWGVIIGGIALVIACLALIKP